MAQTEEAALSKEEWQEWQGHPVTKWFRWAVREVSRQQQDYIGRGGTVRHASDDTAQATARAVGYLNGLSDVLELEPDVGESK